MEKKVLSPTGSLKVIPFSILLLLGLVGGGTEGSAPPTAGTAVQQAEAQYAYVTNGGSQNVSMYRIDQSSGQLQPLGMVPAGDRPQGVAVVPASPPNQFGVSVWPMFVVNKNSNNVSMYTVDPGTGQLHPMSTVSAGNGPQAIAVCSVNPATAGNATEGTAVDPQANMVIVANGRSNNVSVFSVSQATGALNPIQTVAAGKNPVAVAVSPNGSMVFVANQGSSNISVYSVRSNGMLTPVGQPVAMPQGSGAPSSIAVVPPGNMVVATSPSTNSLGILLVNPTSSPSLIPVGVSTVGNGPTCIAISQNGIMAITAVLAFALVLMLSSPVAKTQDEQEEQESSLMATPAITATAGYSHSVVLKDDGTVCTWGYNEYGQVGDSTTNNRDAPYQVEGISAVIAIAAGGGWRTLALKRDGTVWGWGINNDGDLAPLYPLLAQQWIKWSGGRR